MNKRILEYRIWRDKRKRMWYDPNFEMTAVFIPKEQYDQAFQEHTSLLIVT